MSDSIDPSSITAAVLTDLIKSSFHAASQGASSTIKSAWEKIFGDFSPYMEDTYTRNRNVRILCKKDADVDLYDIYVNSNFKSAGKNITDGDLISSFIEGNNIVINGNGGAGKTFFMRHLWLTIFSNPGRFTPIFVELRQLNDLSKIDLRTFVRRTISNKKELTEDLFNYFCDGGRFAFMLDGFDEIPQEHRDELQKQILTFSSSFKKCPIAVSSRFEERFSGWQNFTIFESSPFSLEQVTTLVKNVPFDEESKNIFLRKLNISFFRQNESFLSNPLLAIMMMMTFRENMEIPRRMNIFYDQAFNTLYQWHDATKSYKRNKSMDIEEFQRSFGMFCLLSYYKQVFEFTKSDIVHFINMSSRFCGHTHSADDVLEDYEKSVNLIKQDGLKYTFIHRSFQEYFAAYALVRIIPDKFHEFIDEIRKRTGDSVIPICYEMNPRLVIDNYIRPEFSKWKSKGIFNFKRNSPFYLLNKIAAEYAFMVSFHQRDSLKEDRRPIVGISMNAADEVTYFIESIRMMMGGKPSSHAKEYTRELLFEHEMFDMFHEVNVRSTVGGRFVRVRVTFGPATVDPSIEFEDGPSVASITERIFKDVGGARDCFSKVEARLRAEIKEIATWCSAEISKAENGGKSLNEILGIG
ncbi:NACHT domain-containing protein [Mesorhizobium sp. ASY16-5R]|uniref:NACHT domain-containing protein n=1 Tax=Mesorhizobium sp. ASY16-5R TaxID=3445772 RepID=UPI003F9FD99D